MTSNATRCLPWRLYAILDRAALADRDPVVVASAAIRGGADAIQWRDKQASSAQLIEDAARLLPLTQAAGIPLIINDRPDVAQTVGAHGVHLGQEDMPLKDARALLGPGRLIGKSTHSLDQALAAEAEGADYIGLGPIFPTPTKPNYGSVGLSLITEVVPKLHISAVCIGGIDATNVQRVFAAGARCIAVVRALCAAPHPEEATRLLKKNIIEFLRRNVPEQHFY